MLIRALRMQIQPSNEQKLQIFKTVSACRFIYNHMLERNTKAYKRRREHLSYNNMQNLLHAMKDYLPWLRDADARALQFACRNLDAAFRKFFTHKAQYPKFHSKKRPVQSYTTASPQSIYVELGRVRLPLLGWVKTKDDRTLLDGVKVCNATITMDHGLYFVSIAYKTERAIQDQPVHPDRVLGLDYKMDGLYVDANGDGPKMPRYFRRAEKGLARAQRNLSRKKGARKGERPSRNFLRQKQKVFRKHRHVACQRKDFLHKLSTEIANSWDAACTETLNLAAMGNKGFHLGKSVHDSGYGMFLTMLSYKLEDRGKPMIQAAWEFPSSQTCSACGYKNPLVKDLSIRTWDCPACGARHDRDINAARNLRNEGIRILKKQGRIA